MKKIYLNKLDNYIGKKLILQLPSLDYEVTIQVSLGGMYFVVASNQKLIGQIYKGKQNFKGELFEK